MAAKLKSSFRSNNIKKRVTFEMDLVAPQPRPVNEAFIAKRKAEMTKHPQKKLHTLLVAGGAALIATHLGSAIAVLTITRRKKT